MTMPRRGEEKGKEGEWLNESSKTSKDPNPRGLPCFSVKYFSL